MATIHVGYSEGCPHGLSNRGVILLKNSEIPIIGAVSANHFMVQLDGINDVREEEEALLLGGEGASSISRVAHLTGTSVYKVLMGLNPLLPRLYFKKGMPVELQIPIYHKIGDGPSRAR